MTRSTGFRVGRIALLALIMAMLAMPQAALAQTTVQVGRVADDPWSGYWWSMYDGNLSLYDDGQALDLYDRYMKATRDQDSGAQAWEKRYRSTSNPDNRWFGYCHAWAAAAILTRRPPSSVTRGGVTFHTNAVRGLITNTYWAPQVAWLRGTRNRTPNTVSNDIEPAWMDYLMRLYVGYYRYPIIMDIDPGTEVWNFPAFAYHRVATENSNGSTSVRMRVWYANAHANVSGTTSFHRDYTYTLRPGTLGQWTGASVKDHPDFAWLPMGRERSNPDSPRNPHVNPRIVEEIIGNGYRIG